MLLSGGATARESDRRRWSGVEVDKVASNLHLRVCTCLLHRARESAGRMSGQWSKALPMNLSYLGFDGDCKHSVCREIDSAAADHHTL